MKRIILFILTFLILVLEVSLFRNISFFGSFANIFLMYLIVMLFILPKKTVFYAAFFGGLFTGAFSGFALGAESAIYLLILLLVLLLHQYIFTNINTLLLVLISAITTFVYDLFTWILYKFSGLELDIIRLLSVNLLGQIIINAILILLLYIAAKPLWDTIDRMEKGPKFI